MMKKYIVYPGYVVSRRDRDSHYITSEQLMRLHGVSPRDCIIVRIEEDYRRLKVVDTSKMIALYPRSDGNYKSYLECAHSPK